MKAFLKVAVASAVTVFLATAYSVKAASTNVVQHINFQLTLLTQGPQRTNHLATNDVTSTLVRTPITTKTVIAWLGAAMNTNGATNMFSGKASLVRVKHFNSETNNTTIEIRDGTNAPVDVTAFFAGTHISHQVRNSTYHRATGLANGNNYGVLHIVLTNVPPYKLVSHFSVSGFETTSFVPTQSGKSRVVADEVDAPNVAGMGAGTNGVVGVIEGTASSRGSYTEMKDD